MGQYYRPYVENDEEAKVFRSYDYNNGAKLLEHSYFGNEFVGAVCLTLLNNPHRVWWVGDYATEEGDFTTAYEYVYERAWEEKDTTRETSDFNFEGKWFLLNHTQCSYIDLTECKLENRDKWGYCIHPLPLLTAVGNGRGGGDYHSCYPNFDIVGCYAGDVLEISAKIPEGYCNHTELGYFKEEEI